MAELRTRNGKYTLRFYFRNKRHELGLRTASEKRAKAIQGKIEDLLAGARLNLALTPELAAWLAKVDKEIRKKLERIGLVESADDPSESVTLRQHIEAYVKRRSDVKPATKINWRHTKRNLLAHFGDERTLDSITVADAKDFERFLRTDAREHGYDEAKKADGLAHNTARKRIANCKQFFSDAVDRGLITSNPFEKLKSATEGNEARQFYVTAETIQKVIEKAPSAEWKLIIALSRFAGLRCPSEHLALRWEHVDLAGGTMIVLSPKTEHHLGKDRRTVPVFADLKPYLEDAWEQYGELTDCVIPTYQKTTEAAFRTQMRKLIKKAGFTPWPKTFHNLRLSCQTDLEDRLPSHVVCKFLGNSPRVAQKHYLKTTEEHFEKARNMPLFCPRKDPQEAASEDQETKKPASNRSIPQHDAGGWATQDSNQRPPPCEDGALTN